jgi:hypothetical protein
LHSWNQLKDTGSESCLPVWVEVRQLHRLML